MELYAAAKQQEELDPNSIALCTNVTNVILNTFFWGQKPAISNHYTSDKTVKPAAFMQAILESVVGWIPILSHVIT